jgi:hypothetical protein
MEKLKFKRKGIIYTLFKLTWARDNEPSDICEYRSKEIKAILINTLLLPAVITRIITRAFLSKNSDFREDGIAFTVLHTLFFLVFIVTSIVIADDMGEEWSAIYLLYSLLIMVSISIATILMIILISYLHDAYYERKYRKKAQYKEPGKLRLAYDSWKEKWCTPIEWINKE